MFSRPKKQHTAPGSKRRTCVQNAFFQLGIPPTYVYLGRHWRHSHDKMDQAFPLRLCIPQVIKNWMVGRPGNEARGNTQVVGTVALYLS